MPRKKISQVRHSLKQIKSKKNKRKSMWLRDAQSILNVTTSNIEKRKPLGDDTFFPSHLQRGNALTKKTTVTIRHKKRVSKIIYTGNAPPYHATFGQRQWNAEYSTKKKGGEKNTPAFPTYTNSLTPLFTNSGNNNVLLLQSPRSAKVRSISVLQVVNSRSGLTPNSALTEGRLR